MTTSFDLDGYLAGLMAQSAEEEFEWNSGPVWNRAEFDRDFDLVRFAGGPFVAVRCKADGQVGTLEFIADQDGQPLRYFAFEPA